MSNSGWLPIRACSAGAIHRQRRGRHPMLVTRSSSPSFTSRRSVRPPRAVHRSSPGAGLRAAGAVRPPAGDAGHPAELHPGEQRGGPTTPKPFLGLALAATGAALLLGLIVTVALALLIHQKAGQRGGSPTAAGMGDKSPRVVPLAAGFATTVTTPNGNRAGEQLDPPPATPEHRAEDGVGDGDLAAWTTRSSRRPGRHRLAAGPARRGGTGLVLTVLVALSTLKDLRSPLAVLVGATAGSRRADRERAHICPGRAALAGVRRLARASGTVAPEMGTRGGGRCRAAGVHRADRSDGEQQAGGHPTRAARGHRRLPVAFVTRRMPDRRCMGCS